MISQLFVCTLIVGAVLCEKKDTKPPLQMKLVKIENCPGIENEIVSEIQITKYNDTHNLYSGSGTLPYDVGDDTTIQVNVAKHLSGDKWDEDFFNIKKDNMCSHLSEMLGEVLFKVQDKIGMPRNKCPFPKGSYSVKYISVELEHIVLPRSTEGTMRATIKLWKSDKVISCKVATVEVY